MLIHVNIQSSVLRMLLGYYPARLSQANMGMAQFLMSKVKERKTWLSLLELTQAHPKKKKWRDVFTMSAEVYIFGMLDYLILGSGQKQWWADGVESVKRDERHALK